MSRGKHLLRGSTVPSYCVLPPVHFGQDLVYSGKTGYEPSRNVDPADHEMSLVNQDPPSIPVGVQQPRAPLEDRGSQQPVQWLSVQADHMAGFLQQNVRALMVRASSPMPSVDRQQDEVARLRTQLQHSKKVNGDMRALLQNQALAIEKFQNRWQMAGQEAHAFVVRTRSESKDFVRAELGAIEKFEDRMQRQYSGELQQHVHALQDECRAHVGPGGVQVAERAHQCFDS